MQQLYIKFTIEQNDSIFKDTPIFFNTKKQNGRFTPLRIERNLQPQKAILHSICITLKNKIQTLKFSLFFPRQYIHGSISRNGEQCARKINFALRLHSRVSTKRHFGDHCWHVCRRRSGQENRRSIWPVGNGRKLTRSVRGNVVIALW